MSQWGTLDTKAVTGTIAVTQNNRAVTGSGTAFTTELKSGQTLVIAGVEYQIDAIASNIALTLRVPYAGTTASGLTVTGNEQPAYAPHADLPNIFGISQAEAAQTQNRAKGINTPGWVKYTTYTDAQSTTRHRAEALVAFGGTGITGDADTFAPVPVITIGTQPLDVTVTAPATATFTAAATATLGGVVSYQWQIQQEGTGAWANISGATSANYTTGATATGDGAGATDGDKYRVVVSATLGATPVTSNAVTLTVQ
ncbi:hypothetical protein UFOVP410_71 [uncultured Caudovirales phage]|uniref:Uncharacterized protein n=1 Tax=uncultured Caudovirales phage TaxID=2100421 RepID=A0A6J5M500_9CAUD|nr:hypothetical protein UFOVP410_71 [uncultured Caudovirales phage]